MPGFQAFNDSGIEIFNAENKVLRASGYYAENIFYTDGVSHLTITQDQSPGVWTAGGISYGAGNTIQWFRAPLGRVIAPIQGFIYGTAGYTYERLVGSPTQATGAGQYLEVFDGNGVQMFSAATLGSTPIVRGVIMVPPNMGSGMITLNTGLPYGTNPWICASASPGEYGDDGTVADIWYYIYKFINGGTQVQVQSFNTPGIHNSLITSGFSVPIATIADYP